METQTTSNTGIGEVHPVREVYGHEINGLNQQLVVSADMPGPGNAPHNYWINSIHGWPSDAPFEPVHIKFQHGPIAENGINGISNESLLSVVRDRLTGFQSGDFACRENALALTKVEEALHWLHHRTQNRVHRGVEGTNKK
jgi:hypothetical protein